MKAASLHELKLEMAGLTQKQVLELCLRLARFKKENKELLTYLLLEAHYEAGYVQGIQEEIAVHFDSINLSQLYFAKKSLRKILRLISKYSRYSNARETEIELRLFFTMKLIESGIPLDRNTVIENMYNAQLKKINGLIETLDEDLQFDYRKQLQGLQPAPIEKKTWTLFLKK